MSGHQRIFGYDLLRALAVLLVFFGHGEYWLSGLQGANTDGVIAGFRAAKEPFGLWGVELFFALSGALVGGILLRTMENDGVPLHKRLARFWVRRWLRILPAYWCVLLLTWIFYHWRNEYTPSWHFVLFVQNIATRHPPIFGEAWSLSVEEWSYLLVPLLMVIGYGAYRLHRWGALTAILVLLFAGMALRFQHALAHPELHPDEDLRKLVLYRMDALAFGLLSAYALRYHADLARKWRYALLGLGLLLWAVEAWSGYSPEGRLFGHGHFERGSSMLLWACDLTWLGAAFALMMPWAAHAALPRPFWWARPIAWVSVISYSLYLVHRNLLLIPLSLADREEWHLPGVAFALLYVVSAFGAAALLHYGVERPFMRWRDRRWKET